MTTVHAEDAANAIDLRSDTVTRPTAGDARGDGAAPVGDDLYGEDPTVNPLQERVAALLGKEAALFLPTGTMANQIALRVLTRPGDDVLVSREATRCGTRPAARRANAGVQFTESARRRCSAPSEFVAARQAARPRHLPADDAGRDREHPQPRRRRVFPQEGRARLRRAPRERGIATSSTARGSGTPRVATGAAAGRARRARSTWSRSSLSKGLGAPGGSLLAGPRELIARAVRAPAHARRRDAPGRHLRGRRPATRSTTTSRGSPTTTRTRAASPSGSRASPASRLDLATVQTNIVVFTLGAGGAGRRRRSSRARASAACSSSRSARARSARSPTSTCRGRSAAGRRRACRDHRCAG